MDGAYGQWHQHVYAAKEWQLERTEFAADNKNIFKYDRGPQSGATMASDGKTLLLYMSNKGNC